MRPRILLVWLLAAQLSAAAENDPLHWSFRSLQQVVMPEVPPASRGHNPVDAFVTAAQVVQGVQASPPAQREVLIRRLYFGLLGLPPSPSELDAAVQDTTPDGYSRLVERLLASPQYGEHWGKFWLDAAGYADSNGYFNADTNRPWAHQYRDYVIRSWNADAPYPQFIKEQLAGDELADFAPGDPVTERVVRLLTATHFLRNGQDGSGESDGNPDEVIVDRATVLEGTLQIAMNTLLGLTIQCARCHDHKFEPITQREYYQLQAVFYPAFPALHNDLWRTPQQRFIDVPLPQTLARWQSRETRRDAVVAQARRQLAEWVAANRPPAAIHFADDFQTPAGKLVNWSSTAPGDDAPGGQPVVQIDSAEAPGALIRDGVLEIHEAGQSGNRWLSTREAIDWTPAAEGEWIQVTFDLVDDKIDPAGKSAARIGYYIALHDYDDSSSRAGGNLLVDGNPGGPTYVQLDYPGSDQRSLGAITETRYRPGRNYGVRITRLDGNQFRLQHVVDWRPEDKSITLRADDLPDGGFGVEYCCDRSFRIDNVLIESNTVQGGTAVDADLWKVFYEQYQRRAETLRELIETRGKQRQKKPGRVAWVTDVARPAPVVHVLERGLYAEPGAAVVPGGLLRLTDADNPYVVPGSETPARSSGRRRALAEWLTRDGSRPAALLARVLVNRVWKHHFGRGLVPTPDNLGQSGTPPTHLELLDYLATEFVHNGWSIKMLNHQIVHTAVYRQSSAPRRAALAVDSQNRWLWRFSPRRLEAESVRDAMLSASGELDRRMFGRYVPTTRRPDGNVVVEESQRGARRRGIYLQQRRTQINSLLALFDAPSMVSTCGDRNRSTVPLQSLALLNSTFVRQRALAMAGRILGDDRSGESGQITRAFRLALGRPPVSAEHAAAVEFLGKQRVVYAAAADRDRRIWTDFCQMLFASNAFLYVE